MTHDENIVEIVIYTDGSCLGNPGPGGYCAILTAWGPDQKMAKEPRIIKGGSPHTTNNIMELTAVIEGLKALNRDGLELAIVTDSQYVKNGFESWIKQWKHNGWKTSKKQDVKNKALWQQLDELVNRHSIQWRWTKGHAGHKWNTQADEIAQAEARAQQ